MPFLRDFGNKGPDVVGNPDYASAMESIWGGNPWFQQMRAQQMAQFPPVPIVTMPLADWERYQHSLNVQQREIDEWKQKHDFLNKLNLSRGITIRFWRERELLKYFKRFKFVALNDDRSDKCIYIPAPCAEDYATYSAFIRCRNSVWQIITDQSDDPKKAEVVTFRLDMAVKGCKLFDKIRRRNIDFIDSGKKFEIPVNIFDVPSILPQSLTGFANAATQAYKDKVKAEKQPRKVRK